MTIRHILKAVFLTLGSLAFAGLSGAHDDQAADPYQPQPGVEISHPNWAKDAVLYQINTRQYSEAGTFKAVEADLPRIKDLGVDILWLMPIHPIGETNRKGTLGSPYSVKDYLGVNPEFGTEQDFRDLVDAAHALDLKIILDWVANHSAWDNPLVEEHPDWYIRDWKGDFVPTPWWDWSDIIDFDYTQPGIRKYMTDAMTYWVEEMDVDGFRADVACYIPIDLWEHIRRELEAVKPVFMLGECDNRDLHRKAFDATYAWQWKNAMKSLADGQSNATGLYGYYAEKGSAWPDDAYRMTYTSNHDQNSWDEPAPHFYGDAYENAIVLSFVGDGLPLIYNGQEAHNEKQLEFFEKDPIEWKEHPIEDLFKSLIDLKTENDLLWNGAAGAPMVKVENSNPEQIFSFIRQRDGKAVLAVFNMSGEQAQFSFVDALPEGAYEEFESGDRAEIRAEEVRTMPPWSWRIYTR